MSVPRTYAALMHFVSTLLAASAANASLDTLEMALFAQV